MKIIPLTRGKSVIVDDEDYEYLNQFKWHFSTNRYAARTVKDPETGKWAPKQMHTFIMNTPKDLEVDHINGDTLDNRKANLRLVTHQQNCFNKDGRKGKAYKGVFLSKDPWRLKKYSASITLNYKRKYLGYFMTLGEALRAYNKAARLYHGEYAKLNFEEV